MLSLATTTTEQPMPEVLAQMLLVIGVVAIGVLLTVSIRRKIALKNAATPEPRQQIAQAKSVRRLTQDKYAVSSELHDTAQRLAASMDSKAERLEQLTRNRVALWDVMSACRRESSLDSDIIDASIVPNDFAAFFDAHPEIDRVYFNGAKAESAYRKHVTAKLCSPDPVRYFRLPSTSPAHASLSLQQKLIAWKRITARA